MEYQDLEVVLDDTRLMADKYFLISQSDHVRSKFHFDETDPKSIEFPGVDKETWDVAMLYLKTSAWAKRDNGVTPDILYNIASFYKEFRFSKGLAACSSWCEDHSVWHNQGEFNDNFPIAAIAVDLNLDFIEKVKERTKEFLVKCPNYCFFQSEDSMISLLFCFGLGSEDEDNKNLRRGAAKVLCNAYDEDNTVNVWGIREEALKRHDWDEIGHYLSKEAVKAILSDSSYLRHSCYQPRSNKRRRIMSNGTV